MSSIQIRRACLLLIVAGVAACSDATAPVSLKTRHDAQIETAVGLKTRHDGTVVTANGVGTSPRPQP